MQFFVIGALLAGALLSLCSPAKPQENSKPAAPNTSGFGAIDGLLIRDLHVGFDGRYQVGVWTPVRITLAASAPLAATIELTVSDGDGAPAAYRDAGPSEVHLEAGETTITRYVKFGRAGGPLTLSVRARAVSDKEQSNRAQMYHADRVLSRGDLDGAVSHGDELILSFGDEIGVSDVLKRRRRGGEGVVYVPLADPAGLPDRWFGYEGVDRMIIAAGDAELLSRLSSEQVTAIKEWVLQGGRLLFSTGSSSDRLLSADSPWRVFAPGEFRAVENARRTNNLENYAGANLPIAGGDKAAPLRVARLSGVRGVVEVQEGRQPGDEWIIRFPIGFGEATFVAFDLGREPLSNWPERPKLIEKLLSESFSRSSEAAAGGQTVHGEQVGYDDLSGQLRGSLDQFRGIHVVAFSAVAGLLIAYILLIGPADYFLLKRLNRLEWTWITFPLIVVGFCLLAWGLWTNLRSPRLRLNQLDLVDVDLESSQVRGVSWTHLYSPQNDSYDLAFESPAFVSSAVNERSTEAGAMLSWHGLPGEGLGGMSGQSLSAPFEQPYTIAVDQNASGQDRPPPRLSGLPIQISSTKSLIGQWWSQAQFEAPWRLTVDQNGMLHGEIGNPLDVALIDCRVFYGRLAYQIDGRLAPGDSIDLDDLPSPRTLEWMLAKKKIVENDDVSTPWDRAGSDTARILEVMMFHDAAGGRAYTDLRNRFQGNLDLSGHLTIGRAILVGRAESPPTKLLRNGRSLADNYDRRYAFYRVMAPVISDRSAPAETPANE